MFHHEYNVRTGYKVATYFASRLVLACLIPSYLRRSLSFLARVVCSPYCSVRIYLSSIYLPSTPHSYPISTRLVLSYLFVFSFYLSPFFSSFFPPFPPFLLFRLPLPLLRFCNIAIVLITPLSTLLSLDILLAPFYPSSLCS